MKDETQSPAAEHEPESADPDHATTDHAATVSGHPAAGARPVADRLTVAAAVATFVAAALVIVLPAAVPSQDYPGHLAAVALRLDPSSGGGFIAPNLPLTGAAFHLVASLFGLAVGPEWGGRIALLAFGALGAWGAGRLARRAGSSAWLLASVFASAWVGWTLAMGFVNFSGGFALGLAAGGVLVGSSTTVGGRSRAAIGAAVLAASVVGHVLGGGMALVFVSVVVFGAASRGARLAGALPLVPAAVVAAVLVSLSFASGRTAETVETLQEVVRSPLTELLGGLATTPFVSFGRVAVVLSPALAVGGVVAARRGRIASVIRWSIPGWLVLYSAVPLHGLGLAFAGPRVTLGLVLAVAMTIDPRRARTAALLTATCLAATASAIPGAVAWGARIDEARAAFGERRSGFQFAVLFDDGVRPPAPHANPCIGLSEYAGGVGSAAFNVNPVRDAALLTERGWSERPQGRLFEVASPCADDLAVCTERAEALGERVALAALEWDSVVAIGAEEAFSDVLVERGYEQVAPARWLPRPARLELLFVAPPVEPYVVQIVLPGRGPIAQVESVGAGAELGPLPPGEVGLVVGTRQGEVVFSAPLTLEPGSTRSVTIGGGR